MTVKGKFCIAAGVRVPVTSMQEDAIVFIALFIMNISWMDYIFVIQKKLGKAIP